jgi:hypothetical protein
VLRQFRQLDEHADRSQGLSLVLAGGSTCASRVSAAIHIDEYHSANRHSTGVAVRDACAVIRRPPRR